MKTFEARVVKGRLVIDAPSPYPEGAKVRLVAADEPGDEELDADEEAALDDVLKRATADFKAGRTHSLEEVIKGRRRIQ